MTKSCRSFMDSTGQIRTSKSQSAQPRWPCMVMSLESWTKFVRSELPRSATRSERRELRVLSPQALRVLRHRALLLHLHLHRPQSPRHSSTERRQSSLQFGNRLCAVTDIVFHFCGQLSKSFFESIWNKDRIVSEPL